MMKKIYVCPEIIDNVEIVLETMVNQSVGHQVQDGNEYNYGGIQEEDDEAAASMRGGSSDFGSLW